MKPAPNASYPIFPALDSLPTLFAPNSTNSAPAAPPCFNHAGVFRLPEESVTTTVFAEPVNVVALEPEDVAETETLANEPETVTDTGSPTKSIVVILPCETPSS